MHNSNMWNPPFSFEAWDSDLNFPFLKTVVNSVITDNALWSDSYAPKSVDSITTFPLPYHPQYSPNLPTLGNTHFDAVSATIQSLPPDENSSNLMEISELLGQTSTLQAPAQEFYVEDSSSSFDKNRHYANSDRELSTEEVMRAAAFHFIQMSSRRDEIPPLLRQPFGLVMSGLNDTGVKNVELANTLLAAAEKVSNQQYARANTLLDQCYKFSSNTGNPVERIVYYFSHALQERISRETGRFPWKQKNEVSDLTAQNVIKTMLADHPVHLVAHNRLPFSQILQFTSIQAILEKIGNARRVHMIDLSIKHGLQWTILMQALATRTSCRVESLKITAIGFSYEAMFATGSRLSSFAETLNLPFKFVTVVTGDLKELREDAIETVEGEAVGVYSGEAMSGLIVTPDSLENLMRVIVRVRPLVMIVIDIEAKHNSPSFIDRFTEALFYYSALFDCLDGMMEGGDGSRMVLEGVFYAQAIRNIVAAEGSERVVRHVGIGVWRRFFARFGFVEAELSEWSLYQASFLLKQFEKGESCTLEKDGKSLLVGWEGTPVNFISSWKFQGKGLRM